MTSTPDRRLRLLAAASAALLVLLTGCSGGEEDGDQATTPAETLAEAKTKLDETSGVSLSLSTDELPDGIDGMLDTTGFANHAPGFDGVVDVRANGIELEVPVVAVDGEVFAQLPFTSEFVEIEPEDYGAPDPAAFMDTTTGVSSWLTAAEGVEEGEQTRDGDRVLTTYTGSLPGTAVAEVIPSAATDESFDVTFRIDDDGRLTGADVAGPFYGDAGDVAYTLTLDDYGTEEDITRP